MSRDPLEEALFVDRSARDPDAPVSPFVAMQRVVVRMLFDPAFVEEVYNSPGQALTGLDLDEGLVRQLLQNDRRLWNADRLRRSRSLKILMEELKVSSTLALAESRRLSFLDSFFGSSLFHEAVQRRRYMALAYVAFLEESLASGTLRSRHLAAALGLEAAMARSRRALRDAGRGRDPALAPVTAGRRGRRLVAGPGVSCHFAPAGTIALIQHVEEYLFQAAQVPGLALCDDAPRPEPLPDLREGELQPFLLEPQPGGRVELSEVAARFAWVIAACARPVDPELLDAAVAAKGLRGAEAWELARSLQEASVLREVEVEADGLVRATSPPAGPP